MLLNFLISLALGADAVTPDGPDIVLGLGEGSSDRRAVKARTLNDTDFDFVPPTNAAAWKSRASDLKLQVQIACGLYPYPAKTPLNATIRPGAIRDGYRVDKVVFESLPGHLVTGNLYVPTDKASGLRPAVLCPHGHWANGRFFSAPDATIASELKNGAEKTPEGARSPLQARCAQLARMGCVVFHHDMVGYADNGPIAHRGGYADTSSQLRLHSTMMLQTWNSIRALDFMLALPGIDPARIGVTGASGGGTQTFIVGALDPRPAVAFPAVMVSTRMQGGCVCENASYLRIATGNVEIAALFAPKPMAVSGANDWTVAIETHGLPQLKSLYGTLGSPKNIAGKCWPEFGHNYNQVARESMYSWFNKHLKLGAQEPVLEQPFVLVPQAELSTYDTNYKRPSTSLDELSLNQSLAKMEDADLKERFPDSTAKAQAWKKHLEPVHKVLLGGPVPTPSLYTVEIKGTRPLAGGATIESKMIRRTEDGAVVPALFLRPVGDVKSTLVWVHPEGKKSLFNKGKLIPAATEALNGGTAILAIDLLGLGESPAPKATVDTKFPAYTWCYNRPLITERVRDLLLALSHARDQSKPVKLAGFGAMGPIALLARSAAGELVTASVIDANQFSFASIKDTTHPDLLPGALRYGDLGGLACGGNGSLTLSGTSDSTKAWLTAYYKAISGQTPKYIAPERMADEVQVLIR